MSDDGAKKGRARKKFGWGKIVFLVLVAAILALFGPVYVDMKTRPYVDPAMDLSRNTLIKILRHKVSEGDWPTDLEAFLPDAKTELPSHVDSVEIARPNSVLVWFNEPFKLSGRYLVLEAIEEEGQFRLVCSVPNVSLGAVSAHCRGLDGSLPWYVSKEELMNAR